MAEGLGQLGALVEPPPADAAQMPVGVAALPPSAFTVRTPVRNQLARNSCTGFAFGTIANILSAGQLVSSPLALYWYFRKESGFQPSQDGGAYMEPCARALTRYGVGSEALWPYDTAKYAQEPPRAYRDQALDHPGTAWYRALSVLGLRTALSLGLPAALGFQVPPDFGKTGLSGTWTDGGGAAVGGHAVCAVGYDDNAQAFLIQNSWGQGWGAKHPEAMGASDMAGWFWLPYSAYPGSRWFDAIVFSALDLEAGR